MLMFVLFLLLLRLLIEPTTGLDPENRQHIWHIIQKIKSPSRLILLTTHSMEEAEALCSRIGIMAKGSLRCIGTAQHLKAKYGKGYTITVNLLPTQAEEEFAARLRALDDFILTDIGGGDPRCAVLSAINRTKKYMVDKAAAPGIAHIFKRMEANKARLGVREWGLSMTTLEEVFVSAVEEEEGEGEEVQV
jgi:ABC-type multidrug transport system ATPase subunit